MWLSEIMLQQTQVVKVIEYFDRFIASFPTLTTLAQAEEHQVMALWSGLGYYNRARNLHRSAKICLSEYGGQLPHNLDELVSLPGIGRSTAAAIMSLAYGQPEPIMDGNVKRVFARHFLVAGEPNKSSTLKQLWSLAEMYREKTEPAAYTQGLMDLGAILCTKHNPKCIDCPINNSCEARKQDVIADYPEKKKKVQQKEVDLYCLLVADGRQVGLSLRDENSIWPSLWFLPTFTSEQKLLASHRQADRQFSLTHKLTHRILHLHVYLARQSQHIEFMDMVDRKLLAERPHPKALIHILNQHDNH